MEPRNPNKRLRLNPGRFSYFTSQNQNPNAPDFNQNLVDELIWSFFSLTDLSSASPSFSIGRSLDRALEKLFQVSGTHDDHSFHDRHLQLTSLLHESAKRCHQKHATLHNSKSWPLPPEVTIEVFSWLDTKSLMQALATCTMFSICAMDPSCYSCIDLTTSARHADDGIVSTMIHRAGKKLRSLKLGCPDQYTTSSLTSSCLTPLSYNHCFKGNLLTSLHIWDPTWLDYDSLCLVLSACSNLTNLKIVGLSAKRLEDVLSILPRKCEKLYIEKERGCGASRLLDISPFVRDYQNITSLSLVGFHISDQNAYSLIRGLRKIRYINLSKTYGLDGYFLRDVTDEDNLLETLILRDCFDLKENNVCRFLEALVKGHCKFIRHIDVSNKGGLLYEGRRYCKAEFPLEKLKEERPGLTFVADFTSPSPSPRWYTSSRRGSPSPSPSRTPSRTPSLSPVHDYFDQDDEEE